MSKTSGHELMTDTGRTPSPLPYKVGDRLVFTEPSSFRVTHVSQDGTLHLISPAGALLRLPPDVVGLLAPARTPSPEVAP